MPGLLFTSGSNTEGDKFIQGLTQDAPAQPASAPAQPQPSTAKKVTSAIGNFFVDSAKQIKGGFEDFGHLVNTATHGIEDDFTLQKKVELQNQQTAATGALLNSVAQLHGAAKKKALETIGSPDRFLTQDDIEKTNHYYTDLGITPDAHTAEVIKKVGEAGLNAFFSASLLEAPISAAAKTGGTILSAYADRTVYGALVKSALIKTGEIASKDIAEDTAKVVGEKLAEEAGIDAKTGFAKAIDYGKKILTRDQSLNIAGKMVNTGLQNAAISTYDQWAEGNNFSTPEERSTAWKSAGLAFLTGAVFEGGVEGATAGGKNLIRSISAQNELKAVQKDLNNIYGNIRIKSILGELDDKPEGAPKLSKADLKNEETFKGMVQNGKSYSTYGEAHQALQDEHNVTFSANQEGTQIESGVRKTKAGYEVNFKHGNFDDYREQLGKLIPMIAEDKGLKLDILNEEVSSIPNSGVREMDTRQAKVQRIIQGLTSEDSEKFRQDFPKTAALFDSVHGKVTNISEADASKAFVLKRIPEQYDQIKYMVNRESNGDPQKEQQLWNDLYDALHHPDISPKQQIALVMKTVEESNKVTKLREYAGQFAAANPQYTDLFNAANKVDGETFGIGKKKLVWESFLKSVGQEKVVDSPFNVAPDENPLGSPAGAKAPDLGTENPTPPPENTLSPSLSPEASPEQVQKAEDLKKDFPDSEGEHAQDKEVFTVELDKASKLVASDYEKAVRIVMGAEEVPKEFNNPQSAKNYITEMVLREAMARGDYGTVGVLASLSAEIGQEQGQALASRKVIDQNSLYGVMTQAQDLIAERQAGETILGKSKKKELDAKIATDKAAIASDIKNALPKEDEFIDNLTC